MISNSTICPRLIRLPEVCNLTGLQVTSIYGRAKEGLFPPPIKITARTSVWPQHEVAAVNRALIAGSSENDLRELVKKLIAERGAERGAAV